MCDFFCIYIFYRDDFAYCKRTLGKAQPKQTCIRGISYRESKKENNPAGLFANIVISMSITPLLLRFFYQWSPYSILLNLFVIPAMSPLLISAVLGGLLGFFSYVAAFLGCIPAVVLLRTFEMIFRLVKQIPGAVIVTGCPPWWEILFCISLRLVFSFYGIIVRRVSV